MKIGIIAVLLLSGFLAFGQNQRYEGSFLNAQKEPGTASYSYFIDAKSGKKIKDGDFRYRVKIKNPNMRLYRNITGKYVNAWKDGLWDFSYSTKDYNTNNDGYFYTYNVTMKANYTNGYPDGAWDYTALVKRRKKLAANSKKAWTPYEIVANTKMKLHFNKGVLVDSIEISRIGSKITGLMNKQGVMQGRFRVLTDSTDLKMDFKDGFLKGINRKNSDVRNDADEYAYFLKYKEDIKSAGAVVDTSSLTFFSEVFTDNVFNDKYFNYQFIDGDRSVHFVGARKNMKVDLKGLYKYELNIFVSKEEESLMRWVFSANINAERKSDDCAKAYAKSNKDAVARKNMDQANAISAKLETYACFVKTYRTTLLPVDLAKRAASCKIDYKVNPAHSRKEILKELYNRSKALEVKSKAIKCN